MTLNSATYLFLATSNEHRMVLVVASGHSLDCTSPTTTPV